MIKYLKQEAITFKYMGLSCYKDNKLHAGTFTPVPLKIHHQLQQRPQYRAGKDLSTNFNRLVITYISFTVALNAPSHALVLIKMNFKIFIVFLR